jgi:hypothetical protein
LDLRADRSFSLWLHFDDFAMDWDLQGKWRGSQPGETAEVSNYRSIELVVENSKLGMPPDLLGQSSDVVQEFEPGSILYVSVNAKEAMWGGPCITFFLSARPVTVTISLRLSTGTPRQLSALAHLVVTAAARCAPPAARRWRRPSPAR